MATGSDGSDNSLYQLLPSDLQTVQEARQYAVQRNSQLLKLQQKVRHMGWIRSFFDSKVPRNEWSILNCINFKRSNPAEIQEQIKKCLDFYQKLIDATDKVDDNLKTEEEAYDPFLIIINLNSELIAMFEFAEKVRENTSSTTVAVLYDNFLSMQKKLENKIKKMECVFLKQQLEAEKKRRESAPPPIFLFGGNQTPGGTRLSPEEVIDLKKENDDLRSIVENLGARLDRIVMDRKDTK